MCELEFSLVVWVEVGVERSSRISNTLTKIYMRNIFAVTYWHWYWYSSFSYFVAAKYVRVEHSNTVHRIFASKFIIIN